MYTGTPQLHGLRQYMLQTGQIKFGGRIPAARGFGALGGEQAIAANHTATFAVARNQVAAKRVEMVDIQTVYCGDVGPHFFGKHLVAQSLCFGHFVLVARQRHAQAAALNR